MSVIYWALVLAPALPFVALSMSYRRILEQKIREVTRRLTAFESEYERAYGQRDTEADIRHELEQFHDWRTYHVPLIVTCIVSCGVALTGLLYLKVPLGLDSLATQTARLGRTPLVGAAGAYLWGLYDLMRRHRSADISSTALHMTWLGILIGGAVGALVAQSIQQPLDLYVAFALGALPIESMKNWVADRANLGLKAAASAPDHMCLISGLTPRLRGRLADEEIDSVESLAFADPVRLLFRTNIEWNVILDLVDQATLIHYVGERIDKLPPIACGAIDVASLYQRIVEDDNGDGRSARVVLGILGTQLGVNEDVAFHLGYLLFHDPLVQFIWAHWDAARPWEDADESAQVHLAKSDKPGGAPMQTAEQALAQDAH
jgi:hypothetical protein